MQVKSVSGKGAALTLLGAVAAYAAFSFLGALLCLWEVVGKKEGAALYFAVGLLGVFFTALAAKGFLKVKGHWAAIVSLLIFGALVFLCSGGQGAKTHVWVYPGCGAGAMLSLITGKRKKKQDLRRRKQRRKK